MPRLPTLRTPVLRELARQLRFESPEAALRQLHRAEDLARQMLDESAARRDGQPAAFPEEWVVFRITGLRTEAGAGQTPGEPGVVVRDALLGDLPALIDRLSAAARITPAALKAADDAWLSADDLCKRWKVSRKTLDRYRRLGLISRRIDLGRGRSRVVYAEASVRAFERLHLARVDDAGEFSRMNPRAVTQVVRRATAYRKRFGWSLHRCAQRIAAREGRTIETIRGVLQRHDAKAAKPIFDEPGPLDSEQAAWLERSSKRGGNVSGSATKLRKSRSAVYRAVGGRRSQRLRDLDLRGPIGPLFARADAGEVLLAHPAASSNLGRPGASSVGELMRMAGAIEPETAANETARAAAYWYLIWSAARGIEALEKKAGNRASSTKLDEIETRLLWASRLKSEMVRAETPLLLRTIEAQTGRRLETISGAVLRELVELGIEALIDAVERFDPFKGGRAASPAGISVTRAISQWLKNNRDRLGSPARAAGKVDLDQFPLPDWSRRLYPWQASLEPPAEVRTRLESLTTRERQVLELRYGWNGAPPRTVAEVASQLRTTPTRIAAMQRRLVARLAYNVDRVPKARRKAKP